MDCIICLEYIKYNCDLVCNHNYHYYCILQWNLNHSDICPYCRTKIKYKNRYVIFFLNVYKIFLLIYVFIKVLFSLLLLMIATYYIYEPLYFYAISCIIYAILFLFNLIIFISYLILTYIFVKLFQIFMNISNHEFQNYLENIFYDII